jgi:hypothetical protein
VAICRQNWVQLPNDESRRAVELAEQFADGFVDAAELQSARDAVVPDTDRRWAEVARLTAANPIALVVNGFHALSRDIFGNPFRTVAFSPEWRTDTAVTLARQMYEARDFSAMPILADALQDAGCDSADVLDHCRGKQGVSGEPPTGSPVQTAPHVRGCWVVDLVLGKE